VDRIMKPFIEQTGVPVVKIDAQCQGSATSVALHQERFVTLGGAPPSSSPLWAVPVCFKTSGGSTQQCDLLERRDQTASLPACSANVFSNANGRGYYFSEYPPEKVLAIARTARSSLAPAERLTLLGDEWWMTRAGRHDIGVYFDIASVHASDEAPSVIEQISSSLGTAHDAIVQPSDAPRFEDWVRRRFGPELMTLGFPGSASDADDRQSRRAALLALVGVTGNSPDVQRQARDLALKYVADPMSVPPTLVSTVLNVAASAGDAMLYDLYMAQLPKSTDKPEAYYRFFNALPSFRDPALVQRTLRFAISPEVRTQDTSTLIAGLLSRSSSQDAAWAFVKENWDALTKTLGIFQGIPRIAGAVGAFCTREKRAEVEQFFKEHPVPAAERTLRRAFERIDSCVAVKERQAPAASSWLASAAR
jgi:puromycin-sensitive aminopeptidase